jgi:hypothetical protein
MHPRNVRRAVAGVVLGLAAVASLTACRVEQGTAVFVGDTRITEDQVNQLVDGLPLQEDSPLGGLRALTVDALTVVELGEQVAAKTGDSPKKESGDNQRAHWQQQGLKADDEFVALMAKAESYRAMLLEGAEPADPTDEDVDDIADSIGRGRGQQLNASERDQLRVELSDEAGRELVGDRHQIAGFVADYDVNANPRYGDAFIIVTRGQEHQPVITVPLVD